MANYPRNFPFRGFVVGVPFLAPLGTPVSVRCGPLLHACSVHARAEDENYYVATALFSMAAII